MLDLTDGQSETLRVLILAHAHPRLSNGGAEIAAYGMHEALNARANTRSWYLGASPKPQHGRLGIAITQPFGADEFLYTRNGFYDAFCFANADANFWTEFGAILREISPHVIHAHHYHELGVELFAFAKRILPNVTTVLTLHEYLAICNHHGQMVKPGRYELCSAESLTDCANCFPERGARDFFLRKRYIQENFAAVDAFVAPSRFLADRYIAWGVPAERITVIENVRRELEAPAATAKAGGRSVLGTLFGANAPPPARKRTPLRLGFFGQMSPLKGIDILVEAMSQLAETGERAVMLEIFGDSSNQSAEFQKAVAEALARAGRNIMVRGRYRNTDVLRLMASVDIVVVPSIWWENSPVVIQEAYAAGRPVICANIGGMAEKVRPGRDGWHFENRDPSSLAQLLRRLAADPREVAAVTARVAPPAECGTIVQAHLALYGQAVGLPRP